MSATTIASSTVVTTIHCYHNPHSLSSPATPLSLPTFLSLVTIVNHCHLLCLLAVSGLTPAIWVSLRLSGSHACLCIRQIHQCQPLPPPHRPCSLPLFPCHIILVAMSCIQLPPTSMKYYSMYQPVGTIHRGEHTFFLVSPRRFSSLHIVCTLVSIPSSFLSATCNSSRYRSGFCSTRLSRNFKESVVYRSWLTSLHSLHGQIEPDAAPESHLE